jgi:predicted site-specific integrase-resolvase
VEGLASTEEVAEYIGVSPQTMANWAYRGKGPNYIKLDGRRKYDWQDVRDWLEARKVRHG